MTWADLDFGQAWREAERTCREFRMSGPSLTKWLDGYEASAVVNDGRRFSRSYRSGTHDSPVDALNTLTERITKGEG